MTNPNKPSWLAALNTPKIEPAADPSPTKEEHVEQLPQYDAPPPLDLSIPPSTPNTKLPFTFDAAAFEASIGKDVEPSAVVDQDIVVKAAVDPGYKENLLVQDKVRHQMSGADIASKVTQTAQEVQQTMLYPHVVNPVEITYRDGLLEVLDEEYKDHLLSKDKVQLNQEFGLLGRRDCEHVGQGFNNVLNYGGHHELDGPGEEDGPWAPGWAERFGQSHGNPELDADAAKLEGLFGPGTAGLTLDDIAPPLPFLPNEEALLPEPKAGLGPREEAKPWMTNLTVTEQIAFDAHVKAVLGINPLHAAKLIRLKGFESKYVGTINTAEKAENHIVICVNNAEDPGGWEDSGHQAAIRAQHLLETTIKKQEKATQRARWQRYIIECREAWKDAIVYRNLQREVLEEAVKRAHIQYTDAKKMTFQEYLMMIEEAEE